MLLCKVIFFCYYCGVKLFDNIKEKLGTFNLQKELSNSQREVSVQNFDTAKVVGFIFDAEDSSKYQESVKFIKSIKKKGIKVFGLGVISSSENIDALPHEANMRYFSLEEINWYGKPNGKFVDDFLSINFDMFLDISLIEHFAISYIFASAKASYKIVNSGDKAEYADFVIAVDNENSVKNFTDLIVHYLESMRIK